MIELVQIPDQEEGGAHPLHRSTERDVDIHHVVLERVCLHVVSVLGLLLFHDIGDHRGGVDTTVETGDLLQPPRAAHLATDANIPDLSHQITEDDEGHLTQVVLHYANVIMPVSMRDLDHLAEVTILHLMKVVEDIAQNLQTDSTEIIHLYTVITSAHPKIHLVSETCLPGTIEQDRSSCLKLQTWTNQKMLSAFYVV